MGIIVQGKELWSALFTRTRRRVLGLFFGHPERSFYANEVVRLAGVGTGSVQRELARLSEAGLLAVTRVGNQKHYQANRDCPFYPEIRSLVLKTYGVLNVLRQTVGSLEGEIKLAFLFGPAADALSPPGAILDLMMVAGNLKRASAEERLGEAGKMIGREIRLTLLSPERFERLRETGDRRLAEILEEPRILLAGDADIL